MKKDHQLKELRNQQNLLLHLNQKFRSHHDSFWPRIFYCLNRKHVSFKFLKSVEKMLDTIKKSKKKRQISLKLTKLIQSQIV